MKKYIKDVAQFGAGSMMLGGVSAATGAAFPGYAGGLATMGTMMPVMGTLIGAKHAVRMTGDLTKKLSLKKWR